MRVPSFGRYGKGMQAAAFFLCGMIVGAAAFNALLLNQTNLIMQQNHELREQVELAEDLAKQQSKSHTGDAIVRSVVLYVIEAPGKEKLDAVTETTLKEYLLKSLKQSFLGRKIYDIGTDAQMARSLLEGRLFTNIEKKDYSVSIRTILATDGRLTVWVEASPSLRQ